MNEQSSLYTESDVTTGKHGLLSPEKSSLRPRLDRGTLTGSRKKKTTDKPMPDMAFRLMTLAFRVSDVFRSTETVLNEVDIRPGWTVLNFGCGPGRYEPLLSERVGPSGSVYSLDIHPLAVRKVEALADELKLTNVKTILSSCDTGLPDESVDVALLFDIFHMLGNPEAALEEIDRVLKRDGRLACSVDHMSVEKAIDQIMTISRFDLLERGGKVLTFDRRECRGKVLMFERS